MFLAHTNYSLYAGGRNPCMYLASNPDHVFMKLALMVELTTVAKIIIIIIIIIIVIITTVFIEREVTRLIQYRISMYNTSLYHEELT